MAVIHAVIVAALMAGGEAALLRTQRSSSSLASYTFAQFVSDFGRDYQAGSQEYTSRAEHFQTSLDRVNAVNAMNAKEGRAWWAGLHPFMDWSPVERRSLNGFKPNRKGKSSMAALQFAGVTGTAMNASWGGGGEGASASWEGVALRQQGSCGSCWAISAVEAVEARLPGKTRLAAQALVDCVPNPQHCGGKGGCDGATGELAYSFIRDHGIPLESNYAYTAETGSCPMNPLQGSFPAEKRARVSGWTNLPSNKAEPLMQALYSQGPVVVAVDANDWFDYDQGVFDGCKKDAELGHAVLAKGYGGEGNSKYWRIQNSWGANWGEQGHIRLKRQDSAAEEMYCGQDKKPQDGLGCDGGPSEITVCGMCGILYDPMYPEGVTIENGADAAPSAAAPTASFRGYDQFRPEAKFNDEFKMPAKWDFNADDDMKEDRLSAAPKAFEAPKAEAPKADDGIWRPSEPAAKVKKDMEKNAVSEMEEMLRKGI